jgi:hypothetical protein
MDKLRKRHHDENDIGRQQGHSDPVFQSEHRTPGSRIKRGRRARAYDRGGEMRLDDNDDPAANPGDDYVSQIRPNALGARRADRQQRQEYDQPDMLALAESLRRQHQEGRRHDGR